jgi:hypothetical protein
MFAMGLIGRRVNYSVGGKIFCVDLRPSDDPYWPNMLMVLIECDDNDLSDPEGDHYVWMSYEHVEWA